MKLLSWNTNGIRAAMKKGFTEFVASEMPDMLCIQETKAQPEQVDIKLDGYTQVWNAAEKKGYSGTAVFTRHQPLGTVSGIGVQDYDREGRVITVEYADFYLVTVYTPNSQRELLRLEYRMDWDREFLRYLEKLDAVKPVIFCGDLNVAHTEIDLANPAANRRNAGFTDEERSGLSAILGAGFIDTFRHFTKEPGHYTWWTYRYNARARNVGWRLDYFCVSAVLIEKVRRSYILQDVTGSDHCPVGLDIDI